MPRIVLALLLSLLAVGSLTPTASAAGPCDWAPSVCDAIAMVMRYCNQAVAGGCQVAIDDPVPDWLEESVQHLCDHWIQKCDIQTARGHALLP